MTHPHLSSPPDPASDGPVPGGPWAVVPVSIWPGLPAPAAVTGPGPCPGPVSAEAAASVIAAFSRPGDLVAAPDGSPAVIEAAATAGRRSLSGVSVGDPRTGTPPLPSGGPDVLLAPDSPHRGTAVLAVAGCHGPGCCDAQDPGPPGGPALLYAACHRVLAPGGILAVATASAGSDGGPADLAGPVAAARAAGLVYAQHIVLVHAAIAGGRLVPGRAGADTADDPGGVRVHSDLLIFAKPGGGPARA